MSSTVSGDLFGLRKGLVAPWTAQGTWGSSVVVDSLRTFNMKLDTVSGRLEGDDRRKSLASVPVGGSGQLQFGFNTLDVVALITGQSIVSGGTGGTASDEMAVVWQPNPYFGIIIQSYMEDATGALDLFIPKCKLMGSLTFNPQYGQFWSQQIDAEFIDDGGIYGFGKLIRRATASTLAIPPA